MKNLLIAVSVLFLIAFNLQSQISEDSLKKHVYFFAADSNEGRFSGSKVMDRITGYIAEQFKESGIKPIGESYFQIFPIAPYWGRNVIGLIEGSDSILKNEYIVLGAHCDGIGWYMDDDKKVIYNGADDNASGTAAIIEIGRMLAKNRNLLKRSVIVVAFDAEERGLFGSRHFVKKPPVDLRRIKVMFSLDMIGALNLGKKLVFSGCGSFKGGTEFMNKLEKVEGLSVDFISSSNFWKDFTDTNPFYDSTVSCMYVSTGLKSPYHKPEDDAEKIDFPGLLLSARQVYIACLALSAKDEFVFQRTHETVRTVQGPFKLGISVNYNTNYHKYSEGPYLAKSLYGFGGGLFAQLKIYKAFSLKPEVNYMNFGTQSQLGDVRLQAIDIPLSLVLSSGNISGGVFVSAGAYWSYAFDGKIADKKIDWLKQGYKREDYGLQFSFGFDIFNFRLTYLVKSGYSDFFNGTLPGFGKSTNSTFSLSLGYIFLP